MERAIRGGGFVTSERLIPRLLAKRDQLGRVEKDAIFESVLANVSPKRRRVRWWLGVVPAVAVTVAVVLLGPWRSPAAPIGELAARGGGAQAFASFHPSCAGACERGHKIVFDLHGTTGYRYFAAFSKRTDGTVLWYFPSSPDDLSLDLSTQPREGVLDRGIVLGEEHAAGSYRVYGVFSRAPLTREMIRAGFDEPHHAAGPDTTVITADLVIW